ncbi:SulP family inorganic anion transporter [Luteimonas sp. MC1750]|uniref:SulP family inorganic anion transporter n=1 Tax=Luteimonas sp. MC1750 TaxID=2799326 RepID=UPI0018F0CD91|nr:SulP family inorganic anion transporter [Luteimonas sp. MC1750]MBJ6984094.1 STAS domain-containing protein [Luteimonas sp. MC1750]QQO06901.1 STAS domain-containing protein [Luteimonas sp. MC1750]
MIALFEAKRAGLLRAANWPRNLSAGLIVGVVALPLAMAFAIASGVKPEQGLYTAIIAGITVSLFGGSRVQIAGPTGAFIVILAGVVAQFGVGGLLAATLMAGVILVAMGLARLGGVIRFIPDPVIVGFTAGIAVIIWVGQWPYFFGLPSPGEGPFYLKAWGLLGSFGQLHVPTALLGLGSLALALGGPRIPGLSKVPGPLLAMVVATVVVMAFDLPGVATIESTFGAIPRALPAFAVPALSFDVVLLLLPAAFTIAMLGAIESLLSAVVADGMAGTKHDSNQELIGQGIANIVSPLFGGIAATGAIARTATNIRNGGNAPIAGVVHALVLVLILLVVAPWAGKVPLAALAAILFVVAWNMSEAPRFIRMVRRAPTADAVILLITFALTILTDLVVAVNIGVILAMLQFMRRMSASVDVVEQAPAGLRAELAKAGLEALPADVVVYSIDGPFFFGSVDSLERALSWSRQPPRFVALRLERVPFIDATGLKRLESTISNLRARGVHVLLNGANMAVLRKLVRADVVSRDIPGSYFTDLAEALRYVEGLRAADEDAPS